MTNPELVNRLYSPLKETILFADFDHRTGDAKSIVFAEVRLIDGKHYLLKTFPDGRIISKELNPDKVDEVKLEVFKLNRELDAERYGFAEPEPKGWFASIKEKLFRG